MKLREAFGKLTHRSFGARPDSSGAAVKQGQDMRAKAHAMGPFGLTQAEREKAADLVAGHGDHEAAKRIRAGQDNNHPAVHAVAFRKPYKHGE